MFKLDHIAVVVTDLDATLAAFQRAFGMSYEMVPDPNAETSGRIAFAQMGNCDIEVYQPLNEKSRAWRWLQEKGPGVNHLAVRVTDLAAALRDMQLKGIQVIDSAPRPGGRGSRLGNLSPESFEGLTVQLVER
jgi:methylmalonyl-CoA/ethylmalonyl-CoA epimerase